VDEFEEGSLRTITLSESQGIKAVIGRPKGKTTTEVQSYLFEKSKGWTLEKAKKWFEEHESQAVKPGGREHRTRSMVVLLAASEQVATIYLMNTSKNRNGWAVTEKALKEALPTITGKPIGLGEGYKLGHYPNPVDVGTIIGFEMADGYALAKARITDSYAWSKLQSGEWGPVSVVITSYDEECSKCGENLTGIADPFTHECIARGEAYLLINSFRFERVDFVEDPAYPQAGVVAYAEAPRPEPLQLAASYYQGTFNAGGGKNMTNEELEKLREENKQLKAELEKVKADYEALKAEVEAAEKQKREKLIAEVTAKRKEAGLPEAKLEEFETPVLEAMLADAEAVLKLKADSKPKGLLTRNTDEPEPDQLKAAIEKKRFELLGIRRDAGKEADR